jgi:DNA-binding MarR family transcriptional regulator
MRDQRCNGPRAEGGARSATRDNARGTSRRGTKRERAANSTEVRGSTALVESVDYEVLRDLVGFWIRRAEVKVLRSLAVHLGRIGVTPTEVAALILMGSNKRMSQIALAEALGTDQSTVVNLLSGLERRELISRTRDLQDRRYHVLSLTAGGRATLRRSKAALARHNAALQTGLSAAERASLIHALRRFVEA